MTVDQLVFPDVRASDPDTSVAAAVGNRPQRVRHKEIVLAALRAAGPSGLTDFELAVRVGLQQTSCGKRRGDLVKDGLVRPLVGVRRPSPSGALAQVWGGVVSASRRKCQAEIWPQRGNPRHQCRNYAIEVPHETIQGQRVWLCGTHRKVAQRIGLWIFNADQPTVHGGFVRLRRDTSTALAALATVSALPGNPRGR